jgi:RNA polymerase sigma-70 factor (ECF subfamily)
VQRAQGDSPESAAALERLCASYWAPVYSFIRRRGYGRSDAEDLTQAFLAALLQEGFWQRTDRSQGRFRGYLAGALRMFLHDERDRARAWKRGGRAEYVQFDAIEEIERELDGLSGVAEPDPGAAFDRRWAQTLMARVVRRLEDEHGRSGKERQFRTLSRFLTETPSRGDYDQAAAALGASRTTVAVWTHRLRQRFAELLHLEVAETVSDPALVTDEMRHLLHAIGSRGSAM